MPKFLNKDRVRYVGDNYESREALIEGIKVMISEVTNRPIYYIKWIGDEEKFSFGIHEHNLELIKRKDPDWRV
jgi:hypothetical protein